ncbi:hypothetical protein [Actinomadura miaoliensis]|uniref:Uncharacterized protein n=1 Tax=Actinomadura miaoliensis TaxID=430685 RepID=A0ABP7V5D2_9ACTN
MSTSKDIGTRAETAVVRYLRGAGFPQAERRALKGVLDEGDITGTPGIAWEVKARKRPPSDEQIAAWMVETEVERVNAGASFGVLVVRRAGVGPARAAFWWAFLRIEDVAALVNMADKRLYAIPAAMVAGFPRHPARLLLADAVQLLRLAGYGTPLGDEESAS